MRVLASAVCACLCVCASARDREADRNERRNTLFGRTAHNNGREEATLRWRHFGPTEPDPYAGSEPVGLVSLQQSLQAAQSQNSTRRRRNVSSSVEAGKLRAQISAHTRPAATPLAKRATGLRAFPFAARKPEMVSVMVPWRHPPGISGPQNGCARPAKVKQFAANSAQLPRPAAADAAARNVCGFAASRTPLVAAVVVVVVSPRQGKCSTQNPS